MNFKYILLFLLSIGTLGLRAQAYKPKSINLQTRWTKLVNATGSHEEYPRPQLIRDQWQNLNGLWDYAITEKSAGMPHTWQGQILVPFPVESSLSGVKRTLGPHELLWYKRKFKATSSPRDRTMLHFGAVDWQATVFVNGKEVGNHSGGYTAFSFDITNALNEGENELVVRVYDPTDKGIGPHGKQVLNPANIYYTSSSGIWQTVWTETVPRDFVESLTITPDIDKSIVKVIVNSLVGTDVKLKTAGKVISGKSNTIINIPIDNPRFWSPNDPYLYNLKVTLGKDEVSGYFGMRKVSIQKDEKGIDRIFLNNKYMFNLGTLDQGFWPDGLYTAPTDEALAYDIKAIKAMGFNTIRKHIKVEPARWYYHADKLGMMVWQDMVNPNQGLPDGAKQQFEKESMEIVKQLQSFPSITTWVLFNEKWGQYDQERLTTWLKKSDPSRIVNGHSGELLYVNNELRSPSPNAYVASDITDVHSYPNPMMPEKQSGKAWVCGEFGGIGVPVAGHQWDELNGWGYVQVTASELDDKFDRMVKRIKELEKEGLSASIYTQPFDVEGEENGLITYDREIIKIPINRIREIHSQLIDLSKNDLDKNFQVGKNIDKNDNDSRYQEFKGEFEKGKRDSGFLRRLTLMAIRNKDQEGVTKYGNAYVSDLSNIFTRDNLIFLNLITRTSNDIGFAIYQNESAAINAIMGANIAENKVMSIIYKEEIEPYDKADNPDWKTIEEKVIAKYGQLGRERVYGNMLVYYASKGRWKEFGKYYKLYFDIAIPNHRSFIHINNLTWHVFEHIIDVEILSTAIQTVKFDLDNFSGNKPNAIDTYANLLYKAGRTDEAILWEEKAIRLSDNDKEFIETLEKMKKNIPTWDVNKQVK